jgi:hypothetical protein
VTLFDILDPGPLPHASFRARVALRVRAGAWPRRTFALSIVVLAAIQAMAFAFWQAAGAVVPWDSKNHFYPMFRFLGDALRHGIVPLWNPYHFGGYPAVADPQSLIFTPSMMLFALIAPDASMPVFDAVIVGMLGLARRWRWHPAAGLLAGLIFMLGGAAASRLQHTGMIISYAWFPLALWSLQAALDHRSLRRAVAAGLFTTLMALGRDQVAYLLCIALVGAVLRQALRSDDAIAYLRGRLPVIVCAGLVALACMIVPILLTMQFLHDSNRPGIAYGMALEGSLDPVNLLTLFSPNMFGSLDRVYDYWGPGAATVAGNDWTDRTIDYLFVGTVPIVLILWHGIAGGRRVERRARYFVFMLLAALVYALGRHTPLFERIFDWVPGVALYRRPADATFLLNIAAAFISGYLLHRYVEEGLPRIAWARARGWIAPAIAVCGSAWLVGSGLSFANRAGQFEASLERLLCSATLAAVIIVALTLFRDRHRRGLLAMILVAGTAGQLAWRNSASPLNAEPASTYSAYDGLYPDQAAGLAVRRTAIARDELAGRHPRVEILGLDGSWQNAAMVLKLQDTVGYNPLRIAAYERAVGVAESANDLNLRAFPDTFRGYNSRLAALLGLDYLVLDRAIADLPRTFPRPHATLLFAGNKFYVYQLDRAPVPRVYVASHVDIVDSDAIIEDGSLPNFDIASDALLDQDSSELVGNKSLSIARSAGGTPAAPNPSTATITAYGDNRVAVSVDAATAGILVLHDIDYPGWTARVDGHPMPVLRTNLIFRGVEIPAGHHLVEFSFQPVSIGNLVAAASGLLHKDDE